MTDQAAIQAIHASEYESGSDALPRIVWTGTSDDLHVNLISLAAGEAIGEHINQQLDVLLTCVDGDGKLAIDGDDIALGAGSIVLIPMGTKRTTHAGPNGIRYVTCHRRRGGIMPTVKRAP